MMRAILILPLLGLALQAQEARPKSPRTPLERLLPHYGFGMNAMSNVKDWPETAQKEGVRWEFLYVYIVGVEWEEGWLNTFLSRCRRAGAIPLISYYHLMSDGRKKGYKGGEPEVVFRALKDKDLMRAYLEDTRRLFQFLANHPGPVIYHSEADSWNFVQWLATGDTHDGAQCPAAVKSTGVPEAASCDDTVAGFARALLALRDRYAPRNVYMGLSAQDFRAGTAPEKTVKYVNSLGGNRWDILIEGTLGHIYKKEGAGFWESLDETAVQQYLKWMSTVSRGTGLRYLNWQIPVGLGDYTLIARYPEKGRLAEYSRAGSIGCLLEIGTDPYKGGVWDFHKGMNVTPSGGLKGTTPAELLKERLLLYSRKPLKLAN
jgi:hypothetical protein